MNNTILTQEAQKFITENLNKDIHKILLKKSPYPNITSKELVEQIESKKKSKKKLPTWYVTKNIYYPNKLNISQTSSEITANYKASLVSGTSLIDLTAGFGVDSHAFSKKVHQVIHIEKDKELSIIAQHNFKQLRIDNVEFVSGNGIEFSQTTKDSFDWIYLDPSRRDQQNKKVYYLSDCEPDITKHQTFLFTKSNNILVKTAPLLDLNIGLQQLTNVKEIHIVAVSNEVKEVLWLLSKNYKGTPEVKTINFNNVKKQIFNFALNEEKIALSEFSLPESYLYEPNAAILKSGAFQHIGNYYNLKKLHPNSHLYTSTELVEFPGRVFKIISVFDYSKKAFKKLAIKKANVTTRNFPDSVEQIRKKLKLKDGGENYLFYYRH